MPSDPKPRAMPAARSIEEQVCRWIDHGGGSQYSERFWTLDPIDGTKGFLRGEQYAVALALIVDGRVAVAALACPNLTCPAGNRASRSPSALRAARSFTP